ncbi:uncharacterized protein PRCAT00003340001 [Priceomyces carsonii]|uniref:uncharacterized protein n=1 Tax=Priceomyces carsonii TaxID=28549 RepID=UPI002ED9B437|nr:unnamed protein product [Priceomyces carsonii]
MVEMEEPVDVSYYLGSQVAQNQNSLDIPVTNGEIVSINLHDELPEDPNEIISFLENESCPLKFWISIALAYNSLSKIDESFEIVKTAIESKQFLQEDISSLHTLKAWLYLKLVSQGINKEKNLSDASKELNMVVGGLGNDVSFLSAQAVLHIFKGQLERAQDIFERLIKINQSNCFALLGKAQILLKKTKNYSGALKIYQQVLVLNPLMRPDPRIGIGLCFWFLKDEKMAVQSFERALDIDPENLKAKILLNLAHFNNSFNNSLSDDEFIKNYEQCLREISSNYELSPEDSVVLLTLVTYYFSKEDYTLTEKLLNKIVFKVTGSSNLVKFSKFSQLSKFESIILSQCAFWLGRISFIRADFTQSQKFFHESIKLDENNLLAKLGLGQSQVSRGSIEEATITFESILKTNPKCLEVNYSLGLLYSEHKSRKKQEQAIIILERYLRLSNNRGISSSKNDEGLEFLNKEPVALNAYLVLSKLYENRDINQALNYLKKAIDSRGEMGQEAPLEVYNNIGIFNFLKHNTEDACFYFREALNKLGLSKTFISEDGQPDLYLPEDLKVTLNFNIARSAEADNEVESIGTYKAILKECPNYFSAKLRLLFLDCISSNNSPKKDIKDEIEHLLEVNASNIEIRSFYGWFAKNFGKKLGMKPDADTNHQKETLVEYDSHDCYALISLANIYCLMARDIKSSGADEKKKKYYIRAVELFAKVLSVDPKNVFAAQGLAIVYIENKELNKGLDILRKIRDSLDDLSVYLNLGHVLVDLKQYGKAIESYEIGLARYTNGSDLRILSFLGRAWYLRGVSEKNISALKKALEFSEEAYENFNGSKSSLRFNIAYVQFQIAEVITKLPIEQRNVEDIKEALINLNSAITTLNSLASDDEPYAPYPKAELKARANLGTNTLLNRLNSCLQETTDNISSIENRLEEAKRFREEEEQKKLKEEEEHLAARRLKDEELAKERAKLQEQAQQWAEEARMDVVVDKEDDGLFDEEVAKKSVSKTKSRSKSKKSRKKAVVDDSEDSTTSESDIEPNSKSKPENAGKLKRKGEVEADDNVPSKKKKSYLSKEIIEDSDEDLDDDLFNDDKEQNNVANDLEENKEENV